MRRLLGILPLLGAAARHECLSSCDVSLYINTGFGTLPCESPGVDFGCYPGDSDLMWIRPPCGAVFRCNADHHDTASDPSRQRGSPVRCGSRYFKPAPGQTRLNCSCADSLGRAKHHQHREQGDVSMRQEHGEREQRKACGDARASIDKLGGVSPAYRRLPMQPGANPAVKCCRNKPVSVGGIQWNVTLNFTNRDYAPWPSACEAICDRTPGCRFFSHSVRWQNCLLCAACVPEIMLGDDTCAPSRLASFNTVPRDLSMRTLYPLMRSVPCALRPQMLLSNGPPRTR